MLESLLIPFRSQPATPRLREGYRLIVDPQPSPEEANRLLRVCGESPRSDERWQRAIACSGWHLGIRTPEGLLVGFVRSTSDQALNANLWDLLVDPADPDPNEILAVLLHTALGRLRRELAGCSISVSAPPEAIQHLEALGFVVDPGGIRAMGLTLRPAPP
ncbi:MAG: N-acetyltransferase [Synechococcus sp.]